MKNESRILALSRVFLISSGDEDAITSFEKELNRTSKQLAGEPSFLGRSLLREDQVFRQADPAIGSSHFEIAFFSNIVPFEAIKWACTQPSSGQLHRVDILEPTVDSFHGPALGTGKDQLRDGFKVSLEYIDVANNRLDEYRSIMKKHCGPAAGTLTKERIIDTFRAMESVAVLHQSDDPQVAWNQIHLFEVNITEFDDFMQKFDRSLAAESGEGYLEVFGALDEIRSVPRWSFCRLD